MREARTGCGMDVFLNGRSDLSYCLFEISYSLHVTSCSNKRYIPLLDF